MNGLREMSREEMSERRGPSKGALVEMSAIQAAQRGACRRIERAASSGAIKLPEALERTRFALNRSLRSCGGAEID